MDYGSCRACGQQIRWARTRGGGKIPLDPVPSDSGNVVVVGDLATVLGDHEKALAYAQRSQADETTFYPHHASCPKRSSVPPAAKPPKAESLF